MRTSLSSPRRCAARMKGFPRSSTGRSRSCSRSLVAIATRPQQVCWPISSASSRAARGGLTSRSASIDVVIAPTRSDRLYGRGELVDELRSALHRAEQSSQPIWVRIEWACWRRQIEHGAELHRDAGAPAHPAGRPRRAPHPVLSACRAHPGVHAPEPAVAFAPRVRVARSTRAAARRARHQHRRRALAGTGDGSGHRSTSRAPSARAQGRTGPVRAGLARVSTGGVRTPESVDPVRRRYPVGRPGDARLHRAPADERLDRLPRVHRRAARDRDHARACRVSRAARGRGCARTRCLAFFARTAGAPGVADRLVRPVFWQRRRARRRRRRRAGQDSRQPSVRATAATAARPGRRCRFRAGLHGARVAVRPCARRTAGDE